MYTRLAGKQCYIKSNYSHHEGHEVLKGNSALANRVIQKTAWFSDQLQCGVTKAKVLKTLSCNIFMFFMRFMV